MLPGQPQASWWVIGKSIRGASHLRTHQVNQDRVQSWQASSQHGLPLILAVSDGHGSARSFRSHLGAEFACQTAIDELSDLIKATSLDENLSVVKSICEDRLPRAIVRRWRTTVEDHLSKHPFEGDPLYSSPARHGRAADWKDLETNPYIIYGATLLAVVITSSFMCYLQIGDGNILVVTANETVVPVSEDARLFANETTSLCTHEAWKDFRVSLQPFSGSPPDLIILSTDGYANSFRDQTSFLQVGTDLLTALRTDGLQSTGERLGIWLTEATQQGSGDDVTLGLVYRQAVLGADADFPQPYIIQDLGAPEELSTLLAPPNRESNDAPQTIAGHNEGVEDNVHADLGLPTPNSPVPSSASEPPIEPATQG